MLWYRYFLSKFSTEFLAAFVSDPDSVGPIAACVLFYLSRCQNIQLSVFTSFLHRLWRVASRQEPESTAVPPALQHHSRPSCPSTARRQREEQATGGVGGGRRHQWTAEGGSSGGRPGQSRRRGSRARRGRKSSSLSISKSFRQTRRTSPAGQRR